MEPAPIEASSRRAALASAAIFLALAALASLYGQLHWFHLDPDSLCYMRIASYVAGGDLRLSVSGYWGPLLSWVMVPGVWLFGDPLAAARAAMILSSLVFLAGSASYFARAGLAPTERILAASLVTLAAIGWSKYIFADMLMAGCFLFGYARIVSPDWASNRRSAILGGAAFGLAYLAKPIGFPSSIGLIALAALLAAAVGAADRRAVARAAAWTLLGFAIVAAPWVAILSAKYGRPVFSIGGSLAHAIVGPPDVERFHPTFVTFHTPEPGRFSSWEDPSSLPYKDWSPFASAAYLRYQLKLAWDNFGFVMRAVSSFELLPLGVFCVLCGFFVHAPWRERMRDERWRWALLPLACSLGLYLPLFAGAPRYYWIALPFTLAASLRLTAMLAGESRGALVAARLLVAVSFGAPAVAELAGGFAASARETRSPAFELAEKLASAGVRGPVAGNWSPEGAFYVAYWLDVPYHGHEPRADAARCRASGARIILVDRANLGLAAQLDRDAEFRNLDAALQVAPRDPWRVYKRIEPAATP